LAIWPSQVGDEGLARLALPAKRGRSHHTGLQSTLGGEFVENDMQSL
jgi:hypothetical protein